jgi:sulfonate transport system substrate-binding protein
MEEISMKMLFRAILTIGILSTLLAGIGLAENKPSVIRIGATGSNRPIAGNTFGILQQLGMLEAEFKKDNIKIEWNVFKGAGPASNEALANKSVDFVTFGDLPSIIGRAQGSIKLLAIHETRRSAYTIVQPDSKAKTIADLKGKRWGIDYGTSSHLYWSRLVDRFGFKEKDFKAIEFAGGDGKAAFLAKEIDALNVGTDVYDYISLGQGKVIYGTDKAPDLMGTAGLVVTEEFAKKYPEITYRFVKTYVRAAKLASYPANRAKTLRLWSNTGTSLSAYKKNYNNVPLALIVNPVPDEYVISHLKDGVKFAKEKGVIRKEFDVDKWFDTSYLNRALKELKLEKYWPASDKNGKPTPR